MRSISFGCRDNTHPHEFLLRSKAVNRDDDPEAEMFVTVWRCPVLHTGGIVLEFPAPEA